MHLFSIPWKHPKTVKFPDVFRGEREGTLGANGLNRNECKTIVKHVNK